MKSIKNIKRIYQGDVYISITIEQAVKAQEKGFNLKQFDNLKSIFIKKRDLLKLQFQK